MNQQTEIQPEPIVIHLPNNIPELGGWGLGLVIMAAAVNKYFIQPRLQILNTNLSRSLEVDNLLSGVLHQILNETKADRVLLVEPHNGTIFLSGRHDYKLTCTVEARKPGVSTSKSDIRGIPVTEVREPLFKVIEEGYNIYKGDESVLTPYSKDLYARAGVAESITFCLYKEEKEVLAFVSISWMDEGNVEHINLESTHKLLAQVKSYLNLYKSNLFNKLVGLIRGR